MAMATLALLMAFGLRPREGGFASGIGYRLVVQSALQAVNASSGDAKGCLIMRRSSGTAVAAFDHELRLAPAYSGLSGCACRTPGPWDCA